MNCHCTNILKLEDVDILVYEFNLRKRRTLRFKTIVILKRLLPEGTVLRWEFVETNHRSTRILKPEMVGMHVDSDGALVDEREEYGTSLSTSSHSSKNVNSDCVKENMSDFE